MNLENKYDVIVVGSGLGGATSAYLLSQMEGLKVLVIERGQSVKRDDLDWNPETILVKGRYFPKSPNAYVTQYGRPRAIFKLNEVVGGQTVFYGGAAFRFRKSDFAKWPISFEEFEPYYGQAEVLLQVHGEINNPHDEGRSQQLPFEAPALSAPALRISQSAKKLGYRPYKIPLAIDFNKCQLCNTCDGFPCKVNAKMEGEVGLLDKAIKSGVTLLKETVVTKILHDGKEAHGVIACSQVTGEQVEYRAKTVIVSAGAIHSSALLLNSKVNDQLPAGDIIGKYLMRHCNAVVGGVFPFKTNPEQVFHKQVVISDFYDDLREELGTAVGVIQDIYTPSNDVLKAFLPWPIKWANVMTGFIQNLLCIAEEEPHEQNRVTLLEEGKEDGFPSIHIQHSYSQNDYRRRDYLLKRSKRILRKAGAFIFKKYDIDSFSHAVGTVRFGNDPQTSAMDKNCKIHNFNNLYVVDGSFMPTSGGVNPSLTIVANAIRVMEKVKSQLNN